MARSSKSDPGEEQRWLLGNLLSAQDEERRRIARDLHDQTGQALASTIVVLRRLQGARSLREAKGHATTLRRGLVSALVELGRVVRGLHPGMLDDLGLGPALKRHASDMADALGIPIRVRVSGLGARRLPLPIETALFRIAQEALTNVARHARASRADVVLTRSGAAVRLVVRDDGRGFDPASRRTRNSRSLGLPGIRERAALLAGSAAIESTPGRGTMVVVAFPLRASGARKSRARRRRAG
ncbi:MAG TPA: sensor histidine kinase [Gemmatimonadales bacterium]|nr:sensor histidine kinase [Gemmatimonadales bacterium]